MNLESAAVEDIDNEPDRAKSIHQTIWIASLGRSMEHFPAILINLISGLNVI